MMGCRKIKISIMPNYARRPKPRALARGVASFHLASMQMFIEKS